VYENSKNNKIAYESSHVSYERVICKTMFIIGSRRTSSKRVLKNKQRRHRGISKTGKRKRVGRAYFRHGQLPDVRPYIMPYRSGALFKYSFLSRTTSACGSMRDNITSAYIFTTTFGRSQAKAFESEWRRPFYQHDTHKRYAHVTYKITIIIKYSRTV